MHTDFRNQSGVMRSSGVPYLRWREGTLWGIGSSLICILVGLPLITVLLLSIGDNQDIWNHLVSTVLTDYIVTTLLLMSGVGLGTILIGVSTAWVVTMCRFPGSSIFDWALLLPIAMPSYIIAFVYTDLLEYAGPVQVFLREIFGWSTIHDYWFPEIRSLPGAISMMTLTLYPYVYLLSRAAFLEQCTCVLEVSRTLGSGPWTSFFKVALPLARPAVVIGVSLVLMETVNDFGTVDFFAVKTFTAGIYDVWLNMNSVAGAAQLSMVLLAFVLALIVSERWARGGKGFQHATGRYRTISQIKLRGAAAVAASLTCAVPIVLGFMVPAIILVVYASSHYHETLKADFTGFLSNSLLLSGSAAFITLCAGLFLAYAVRITGSRFIRGAARFAAIGYAIPGAVLAVGIMVPFGAFDNTVDFMMRRFFGIPTGLLLSGTIAAVTFGYVVRFLALSYGSAEAGLTKVTVSMEGACRTLGKGPLGTLRRLHFPLIRSSVLAAALLVFVDGMKELPMTVILRPFNFDTLATFVYQYASDELFEEASLAALTIVASGMIPVVLLSQELRKSRPGHDQKK